MSKSEPMVKLSNHIHYYLSICPVPTSPSCQIPGPTNWRARNPPRRVRLLLSSDGLLSVHSE